MDNVSHFQLWGLRLAGSWLTTPLFVRPAKKIFERAFLCFRCYAWMYSGTSSHIIQVFSSAIVCAKPFRPLQRRSTFQPCFRSRLLWWLHHIAILKTGPRIRYLSAHLCLHVFTRILPVHEVYNSLWLFALYIGSVCHKNPRPVCRRRCMVSVLIANSHMHFHGWTRSLHAGKVHNSSWLISFALPGGTTEESSS